MMSLFFMPGMEGPGPQYKKPGTRIQATRLSVQDPWLSVPASRQVWLFY